MNSANMRIAAVAAVVIILCAGLTYLTQPGDEGESVVGSPWANTMLDGNLPDKRPDAVDDFYTWVNYDGIAGLEVPEDGITGTTYVIGDESEREFIELLTTDGEGEEWETLNMVWNMFLDTETRESLGVTPLQPHIDAVMSLDSVDEYAEYVSGPDKLLFESVMYGPVRTADGELGLSLVPFCVSYSDRESGVSALAAMLERLGLDADEAERTAELGLEASDALMDAYYSGGSVTFTLEEISELYPECRMAETFSSYGFPLDTELRTDGDWLEVYNGMFEDVDLELLKCLTAVRYLDTTMDLLDSESAELRGSLSGAGTVSFADEDDALNLCGTYFPYITTGLYYDNLVSDEARSAVESVVIDILDAYKGMIDDCAWMSNGTKAAALEKLDKMLYSVAESDFGRGLHGCDPSSADNLVELVMMGDRMTTLAYAENVGQPFDPQSLANTMFCDFNAAYYPTCNAFVIYGGILQMVDPSDTETTMATVGDVVAHEISHAFDTTGRFYDSDGEMTDWWTEDDDAVYSARTDALKEAMSSVEVLPDSYLDGDLVIGEAVADLCAMQCLMRIAADTEGFDYGRFFTALADMWCIKYSLEEAEERLAMDPHPPGYLRVNVILQQIPEFHDWLVTSEGDGMWVPPEDRISVW